MRFYSSYLESHQYKQLPLFAKFLLAERLLELSTEQIRLSKVVDIPLLKRLTQFSEEQLLEITKVSMSEYLELLSQNKGLEIIQESITRWKANQLEYIGMFDVVAEDITLINFIRGKSFRKYIPEYSNDVNTALEIIDELDSFLMGSTTASINTYIEILKEEIEKHEKMLLEAQAIAKIGSFDWDLVTSKSSNSPQIYEIFEMEKSQGIERFMENIHPEDRKSVKETLAQSLIEGNYEAEYRYVVNGSTKHVWSKGIVIRNEKGEPLRLVGTVQDVTERKKIEQELLEKTRALEYTNANLEQFAYAASHDLKEPIRKVQVFSTMLRETLEPKMNERESSYFSKLLNASGRMVNLVDGLLDYSKFSKEQQIGFERIDLNKKIANVLEDLEVVIREKEAVINITDSLPTINGNKRQMQQLFQNLIANSIKYSKPNSVPEITISCTEVSGSEIYHHIDVPFDEKFYLIEVKDNGIGFNQEDSERIFNVFTRLHGNHEYKGSGIGLSIAKKVVENHNGFILAESEEGQGTTFKIYLPAS